MAKQAVATYDWDPDHFDCDELARQLSTDSVSVTGDQVRAELGKSALERETSPFLKTDLRDVESHPINACDDPSWRYLKDDKSWYVFGEGTKVEMRYSYGNGKCMVESAYMGNFTFDTDDYELRYRMLEEKDGSYSYLPYLAYIGPTVQDTGIFWGTPTRMPEGLKVADYMYADHTKMTYAPRFGDSVGSAAFCFAGCTSLIRQEYISDYGSCPNGVVDGVELPSCGIQDMTGTYIGCENLQNRFTPLNEKWDRLKNLRSIRSCFDGCGKQGTNTFPLFGTIPNISILRYGVREYGDGHTEDVTPLLTRSGVEDAYRGVTGVHEVNGKDVVKEEVTVMTESLTTNEDSTYYEEHPEELAEVDQEARSEALRFERYDVERDVAAGEVRSNISMRTGGGLTENIIWNAKTQKYELDETGYLTGDKESTKPGGNDIWNTLASAGTGLAVYGISGLFTDKKWLRIVAGAGTGLVLYKTGLLRSTFSPLLSALEGALPEGPFKDLVHKWSVDTDITSHVDEQKAALQSEAIAKDQVCRISDVGTKGIRSASIQEEGIDLYMNNNGAMMGARMCGNGRGACVFSEAAKLGESNVEFEETKQASQAMCETMEASWQKRLDNGEDPQTVYADMTRYYQNIFSGVAAYDQGATGTINRDFADDSTVHELALGGLAMSNRSMMEPVLDSMYRVNEKYHIFTAEDMAQLDTYPISGIGTVTDYVPGCFDIYRADTATNVQMAQELDMYNVPLESDATPVQESVPQASTPTESPVVEQEGDNKSQEQVVTEEQTVPAGEGTKPKTSGAVNRRLPDVPEGTESGYELGFNMG